MGISEHVEELALSRSKDSIAILEEIRAEHTGADNGRFVRWRQMFMDVHFHIQWNRRQGHLLTGSMEVKVLKLEEEEEGRQSEWIGRAQWDCRAAQKVHLKLEVMDLKWNQALWLCFSPVSSIAVNCIGIKQKRQKAEI